MSLEDFEARFRPGIRAELDWIALAEFRAHVQVATFVGDEAKQRLAALFTVWYADPTGADSSWKGPGSRPLRVGEVDRTLHSWPDSRRRTVTALTQAFSASPEPVSLNVPAYQVGGGRHVLLDGNHRAVAVHQAAVGVHLTVCSLVAPVRESILPDLRHHAEPSP
ncbi:hypothetical protein AB0N99_08020 [Streptomyces sp. NPDC093272]|uniref:hypothetical protein n=1 Tax=Streptomyces sp. NPDC093272 TaxID=3154981 RepID=UPI00344087ED